jgi:ATP-dependent helicase/nuclease subunit A
VQWTNEQEQAIRARGGTVLVSAAAGSGKTAVLVERVLRRLTDPVDPIEPAELLVVTFTRAAAAQLRQKLGTALAARAHANPEDSELRRKLLLLPSAQIGTIDSLCARLVRENFAALDVPPDLKLLTTAAAHALEAEIMQTLLQAAYEEDDEAFAALRALLSDAHGDERLAQTIHALHSKAQANAQPTQWLAALGASYHETAEVGKGTWGRFLLREAAEALDTLIMMHRAALDVMDEAARLKLSAAYVSDLALLSRLQEKVRSGDWDAARKAFQSLSFDPMGRQKCEKTDILAWATERRKYMKKVLEKDLRDKFFLWDTAEIARDTALLAPQADALLALTRRYGDALAAHKKALGVADFGDIAHMALHLLIDENGQKTPLAQTIGAGYAEILVDEYQDVNRVQESLFVALSQNETNLFFVGDVKQSIYRFRQAEPTLFLERRAALPRAQAGADGRQTGGKVILGRNFRSRAGITGCVNFLFSQLMQADAGDVDYNADEYLYPAATFLPRHTPDCVLQLLRLRTDEDRDDQQARACAVYIQKLLDSRFQVQGDDGKMRPVRPSDIAVLMRATKRKGGVYAAALARLNIDSQVELRGGFFAGKEIRLALALLQIIDNPVQDVPLLAVLLSPLFGFSEDDVARLGAKKQRLYHRVVTAAQSDTRFADFLAQLQAWRTLSLALPCAQFLGRLFTQCGLWDIVLAMKNGARRQANLLRLRELAAESHASDHPGLSGLLRFFAALQERGEELDAAALTATENAVRIMTIHKSKGLEFPVCIVADCGAAFNDMDAQKPVALAPTAGLGLKLRESDAFGIYKTLAHTAAALENRQLDRAEELRLLYVATTRAKELLIFLGAASGNTTMEHKLQAAAAKIADASRVPGYVVRSAASYLDWLLAAFLRHPDAHEIRAACALPPVSIQSQKECNFSLEAALVDVPDVTEIRHDVPDYPAPSTALVEELHARMTWAYPISAPPGLPAKQTASSFARGDYPDAVAQRVPAFLAEQTRRAAQRGTLLHWTLEHLDFGDAREDLDTALAAIADDGALRTSELTTSERRMIQGFLESDLCRRILAAMPDVQRERQFTARLPIGELYPEYAKSSEKITVIGAADIVFVEDGALVIADYKTDRASGAELRARYAPQLNVYAKALALCTGLPVRDVLLFSLREAQCIALRG